MAKNDLDAFKFDQTKTVIDASKKVRIGIIGTGWIAGSHIREYLKMPDVEIVAGADLIPGKAEEFFKEYGVEGAKCYNSHKELIDAGEVDAVTAALEAGQNHAAVLGEVFGTEVIANPHGEVIKFFDTEN